MSLPRTVWCSPSNPQGTCKPIFLSGAEVCKPMDSATLAIFKGLQTAVNALLKQDNKPTISVDGRIGPKTTAAVNHYSANPFRDCNALSALAPETRASLLNLAGSRAGAAALVDGATTKVRPALATAGFPLWPAVALFGSIGAFFWYEDQKSKGKKKPDMGWF